MLSSQTDRSPRSTPKNASKRSPRPTARKITKDQATGENIALVSASIPSTMSWDSFDDIDFPLPHTRPTSAISSRSGSCSSSRQASRPSSKPSTRPSTPVGKQGQSFGTSILFNENATKVPASLPFSTLSPAAGLHVTSKRARKNATLPKEVKTGEIYSDSESLNFSFHDSTSIVSRVTSSGSKAGGRRTSVNSPVYTTMRPRDSFDLNLSGASDLFSSTYSHSADAFQSLNSSFNFEQENVKKEKPQDKKNGIKKHSSLGSSLLNNTELLSCHVSSFESLDTLGDGAFHQRLENSQVSKYATPTSATTRATTPVLFTLSTLSAKSKAEWEPMKPTSIAAANTALVTDVNMNAYTSPPVTVISSSASVGTNIGGKKSSRLTVIPNDAKIAQILDALTESGTHEQEPGRNLGDDVATTKASSSSSQYLFTTMEGESSIMPFTSPLLIRSKKMDKKSTLKKLPPNLQKDEFENSVVSHLDPPPLEDSDILTKKDVKDVHVEQEQERNERNEHFSLPLAFHPALKSTAFQCFTSPLTHLNCACFAPRITALLHQSFPFTSSKEKKIQKDKKTPKDSIFGLPIRSEFYCPKNEIVTFDYPDLCALDAFQENLLRTTLSVEPTMQSVTFLHNELRRKHQQELLKDQNIRNITLEMDSTKKSLGLFSEMDAIFKDDRSPTDFSFIESENEDNFSTMHSFSVDPLNSTDSTESKNEETIWAQICEEYKDRSMVFKYAQLHNYRQRMRIRKSIQLGHGGMIENYGQKKHFGDQDRNENCIGLNMDELEKQREDVTQNSLRVLRLKKKEGERTVSTAVDVEKNVRDGNVMSGPSFTTKHFYTDSNEIVINDSQDDDTEIEAVEIERLHPTDLAKRRKISTKSYINLPENKNNVPLKTASVAAIDFDRNFEGIRNICEENLYHFDDLLLVFPSAFLHIHSTGKVGYLRFLNTSRPILEIEFGESMLLFRGNYVNTQNLYALKSAQIRRPSFDSAENLHLIESMREEAALFNRETHKLTAPSMFITDTLLVFSEYKWVEGTRVRNLSDVKIEFQEQANDVSIIPQVHTRSFESYISKVETMQ